MTFQQLTYIVEISKCGSINKAAQNLYLSQTAISTSIRALEDEMNIKFFNRSNRGVEFTHEGKEFVSYAISMLEQKKRVESLYKEGVSRHDTVNFIVSSQRFSFVQDAFIRMMKDSDARSFCFGYKEDSMDEVIDDVYNHKADIGIISISPYTETLINHYLEIKGLEFHEIGSMIPGIFCRNNHPLACKSTVTELDLEPYPYIYYEQKLGSAAEFSEEYQPISLRKPTRTIYTNTRATVAELMLQSDAYTIGSGLITASLPGELVSIPLEGAKPVRIGWIATVSTNTPARTINFVERLKEALSIGMDITEQKRSESHQL